MKMDNWLGQGEGEWQQYNSKQKIQKSPGNEVAKKYKKNSQILVSKYRTCNGNDRTIRPAPASNKNPATKPLAKPRSRGGGGGGGGGGLHHKNDGGACRILTR